MVFGILGFVVLVEAGLWTAGSILNALQHSNDIKALGNKTRGEYRIMCVGESTTAGQYPVILEEILSRRDPERKYVVIDKGVVGTNTAAILHRLEADLRAYKPDMVVTMMGVNDYGEHMPYDMSFFAGKKSFLGKSKAYKLGLYLSLHFAAKQKEARDAALERAYGQDAIAGRKDIYAYSDIGRGYREKGDYAKAEAVYKKILEIDPKNSEAHIWLGWIYRNKGLYALAHEALAKALELDPWNAQVYVETGWLYQFQEKYEQAMGAFSKTIMLNPEDVSAYFGLSWVYRESGDYERAEQVLKKAIELNPGDDNIYLGLGHFYFLRNENFKAEEAFKKAAELNPLNDKAYGALFVVYQKTGRQALADEYSGKLDGIRAGYFKPVTADNYRRVRDILLSKGIKMVCVQYPMRPVSSLEKMLGHDKRVFFVDNQMAFREMVNSGGYGSVFVDMVGGDFGHCTKKGNRLLAENIADVIVNKVLKN